MLNFCVSWFERLVGSTVLIVALGLFGLLSMVDYSMRDARADCQTYQQYSFQDNGSTVPCSNTTYCYQYSYSLACSGGQTIVAYKNSNPPPDWCVCGPAAGDPLKYCGETATECGTTIWYWHPTCASGYSCTTNPSQNVRFCKCS